MLSLPNRLPKNDIPLLLRRGVHVRSDIIEFVYKKTNTDSRLRGNDNIVPHFAFIVSTKIDKRATARNRMRRVMSESVRHTLPSMTSCDGIFIARRNFAERPQTEIQMLIEEILKKAGIL